MAVEKGHLEVTELLLNRGADIEARNKVRRYTFLFLSLSMYIYEVYICYMWDVYIIMWDIDWIYSSAYCSREESSGSDEATS